LTCSRFSCACLICTSMSPPAVNKNQ
jgi:hypothetical protein